MIALQNVSDHVISNRRRLNLLDRASIDIPVGRYALLTAAPLVRRPLVDLLCGARSPHGGSIVRDVRTSWAIGRTSLARGQMVGSDLLGMFCRIYDLDRCQSETFLREMVDDKSLFEMRAEEWSPVVRAEFAQALALLPRFDAYITDGNVLFSSGRFGILWRQLFEQRIAGRTLIISSLHPANFFAFCDKALIVDGGTLSIVDALDEALDRYPPRAPVRESAGRGEDAAGDGDADDAESY
jgi:capsular polysaccharide transport system ATP-binding protein